MEEPISDWIVGSGVYVNEVIAVGLSDWIDGHQPIREHITTYCQTINRPSSVFFSWCLPVICREMSACGKQRGQVEVSLFQSRLAISGRLSSPIAP